MTSVIHIITITGSNIIRIYIHIIIILTLIDTISTTVSTGTATSQHGRNSIGTIITWIITNTVDITTTTAAVAVAAIKLHIRC